MSAKDVITPSIDRSRIVAPAVPGNFITRKHLFHLFETGLPGVTVVAAPAGFGKSSLVAQWVESSPLPTVWLSVNATDSTQSFFAHLLAAIRLKFPDFGSDFENEPSANPLLNVQKLTEAARELKQPFNFVLNNGAADSQDVSDLAPRQCSSNNCAQNYSCYITCTLCKPGKPQPNHESRFEILIRRSFSNFSS